MRRRLGQPITRSQALVLRWEVASDKGSKLHTMQRTFTLLQAPLPQYISGREQLVLSIVLPAFQMSANSTTQPTATSSPDVEAQAPAGGSSWVTTTDPYQERVCTQSVKAGLIVLGIAAATGITVSTVCRDGRCSR